MLKKIFVILVFCVLSYALFSQNAPVTTAATIANAVPGQQVTVPVTVTGFNNVRSFYLTLDYEYAKLQFVMGSWNSSLLGAPGSGCTIGDSDLGGGMHRIIISWYAISGMTIPDGSWIAQYTFQYTSGQAPLQWYTVGPYCRYKNGSGVTMNDLPKSSYYINGLVSSPSLMVNARVFLEGAYSNPTMSTTLKSAGLLPLAQPYSGSPWNYAGTESVAAVPANVTDWVLIELRTGTGAGTRVAGRAAFVKSDGTIRDLDGTSLVNFPGLSDGNYYVVIYHRNHLAIMSANSVPLSGSSPIYDFTSSQTQAYGTNPMKALSGGYYGMLAGDANSDGTLTIADRNLWRTFSGSAGYLLTDFTMDGTVTLADLNKWRPNSGSASMVP